LDAGVLAYESLPDFLAILEDIQGVLELPPGRVFVVLNFTRPQERSSGPFAWFSGKKAAQIAVKIEDSRVERTYTVHHALEVSEAQRQGLPVSHLFPKAKILKSFKAIAKEVMHGNSKEGA